MCTGLRFFTLIRYRYLIMKCVNNEQANAELERIASRAARSCHKAGERLFSEGDAADCIYFIESGRVSIFIEKFATREEIQTLGPGEFLGEMAVFFNNRRTASATILEDAALLCLSKSEFLDLVNTDYAIAERIGQICATRSEDLILKEKLIDATGLSRKHLHLGIKGDPSLRESAMTRERHESVVDQALPDLLCRFEDLMINRCVYQVFIGFNNGEIRISSILDPFSEELHPAKRLLDDTYLDRHFPRIDYDLKANLIKSLYQTVQSNGFFSEIQPHLQKAFNNYYENWRPLSSVEVAKTISKLSLLRSIPNYYVRNATISIIKDTIHLQFNCDGTHVVSSEGYQRFLDENL